MLRVSHKMQFFRVFLFAILLLLQAFGEASSISKATNSLETVSGGSRILAVNKHVGLKSINCGHECSRRCSKAFKKKRCKRACKTCCQRCHCVPPGTYGNKDVCPCYARLKTHGNKPKCP